MRSALRSAFEQCFDNIEADHINYLREEVGGVIRIHVINMKRERERERERDNARQTLFSTSHIGEGFHIAIF
jgi:hypothetical protein